MRKCGGKKASVDLVPDEVWKHALGACVALVLHHNRCLVMKDKPCDCTPLFIGTGFGVDSTRASA